MELHLAPEGNNTHIMLISFPIPQKGSIKKY